MSAIRFAPSWLARPQRQRVERELRALFRSDDCSICGTRHPHNSRTVSGFDIAGKVVLAGECCAAKVAVSFGAGIYCSNRREYDFLSARRKPAGGATRQVDGFALAAAAQAAIADADARINHALKFGGCKLTRKVNLLDSAWKDDDRTWFEANPSRAHRARLPFPNEFAPGMEEETAPPGTALVLLVRQVESGCRLKTGVYLAPTLLPVPDIEVLAHTLFEIAVKNEPLPSSREAFMSLVMKYETRAE
jgi:hypothetical protein